MTGATGTPPESSTAPAAPPPPPPPRPRPNLRQRAARFPGTYGLIAITALVFLAQMASDALLGFDAVIALGAKVNTAIAAGQWWRLVTPLFIHVGLWHVFINMYSLFVLGPAVERFFGTGRFLTFYLLTGTAGVIASLAFTRAPSAGASSAIFGLLGALTAFLFLHRRTFGAAGAIQLRQLIFIALINLGIGLAPGIDNWGHVGGLIGGLLMTGALGPRYEPQPDEMLQLRLTDRRDWRRVWPGALVASALLILLAYLAAGAAPR